MPSVPSRVGRIHLTAAVTDDELIVLVADDGRGLNEATPGAGAGRGWALIAEATNEYTIWQRAIGGTLIEMRWSLTPPDAPTAPGDPSVGDSAVAVEALRPVDSAEAST